LFCAACSPRCSSRHLVHAAVPRNHGEALLGPPVMLHALTPSILIIAFMYGWCVTCQLHGYPSAAWHTSAGTLRPQWRPLCLWQRHTFTSLHKPLMPRSPSPVGRKGQLCCPIRLNRLSLSNACVQSGLARPGTLVTLVYHSTVVPTSCSYPGARDVRSITLAENCHARYI